MKIKLAILEKDQKYLNRFVSAFSVKYADKLEIYSFSDQEITLSALENNKVDVLVASNDFKIAPETLPEKCGFAYFVDSPEIDEVNGQRAICKFQKADMIYKQILDIYSEMLGSVAKVKQSDGQAKLVFFTSPSGGTGTSTLAAAYALHCVLKGSSALYLNLELFGASDVFFDAEGKFGMSDIIYALKSKKVNLSMKLESCIKQDANGVSFFSQSKEALDMLEMKSEDIIQLLEALKNSGSYDYIIVDYDFGLNKDARTIYKLADAIVWVSDGSVQANTKIKRAYRALEILEQNEEDNIFERLKLVYNKFNNSTGKKVEECEIQLIGGVPVYIYTDTKQLLEQIATLEMLNNII